MSKYLVYKGAEDKFRWREVNPDNTTVFIEPGVASQSELFVTKEEAIAAVQAIDPTAEIEDRTIPSEGDSE